MKKSLQHRQGQPTEPEMSVEGRKSAPNIEATLARYTRLYDLAPVACYTFDREGTIHLCNVRGASLLGHSPAELHRQGFGTYISDESSAVFSDFLRRVFAKEDKQTCEVTLLPTDQRPQLFVLIEAVADAGGQTCSAAAIDITKRKRERLAAQKNYALLSRLSAQIPGILFQYRLDPDGSTHFPYVNESVQRTYRVTPEQARENASALSNMVHPADAAGLDASMRLSASDLSPWRHEFRMLRPDHGVVWRAVEASPEKLPDGSILWHGYTIDIGERKRVEEELRLSEERWKFALEGAGDAVWDWDMQTDRVEYSPRWKEILGHAEDEVSDAPEEWLGRVHPDDVALSLKNGQVLLAGKQTTTSIELRMRCKDGSWKWILSRGMVIRRDASGKPLRVVGTNSDITARKNMEETLRENEERWKLALEGAGLGVWDWNLQTGECLFSKLWKEILGFAEDELDNAASEWITRLHPEDMSRLVESQQQILDQKKNSDSIEFRLQCKDGRWKWVLGSGILVSRDAAGDALRMVGTISDIDQRKQTEEALRLALCELEDRRREAESLSEAKSRFLNAASHDLRQPLYATQLFADAMETEKLTLSQQKILHNLRLSVDAMSEQLQLLLEFSRLDMGNIQPKLRTITIESICRSLDVTYAPAAKAAGVRLRFRSVAGHVHSDPILITRLLGNLVDNAIKFAPRGTILVCARRCAQGIRFEVRDNGPGIPPEHRQRIFDEYYQIDNPARDAQAGLGLGLSIALRISHLLELPFALQTRVGRGAVFSVILPIDPPVPGNTSGS